MIVVDASVTVLGLLSAGASRRVLAEKALAVPHLIDSEVAHALRRRVLAGEVGAQGAGVALTRWSRLGVRRFATVGHLGRVWQLRDNLSAYDATYVALAEALECDLLTADARLAGVPGPKCSITVLRG